MIGNGDVEAIGGDETDDRQDEKEDGRELMHVDRVVVDCGYWRFEGIVEVSTRLLVALTSKTSVRKVELEVRGNNEGEKL